MQRTKRMYMRLSYRFTKSLNPYPAIGTKLVSKKSDKRLDISIDENALWSGSTS